MKIIFNSKINKEEIIINNKKYNLFDYSRTLNHKYWLDKWANKKIYNNKSIKELFTYKNQTIWYLLDWFVFWGDNYFKNISGIDYVLTIIDILDSNILEDVDAEIYDSHFPIFTEILERVCRKKKVKLNLIKNEDVHIRFESIRKNKTFIRFGIILLFVIKWILSKIRYFFKDKEKTELLIFSNVRFSRKNQEENILFGEIIKRLESHKLKYKIINYDLLPVFSSLKILFKEFLFRKNKCIEDYYSINYFIKNIKMYKYFKNEYNKIKHIKKTENLCIYKGIDISYFMFSRLELIFNSLIYLITDNIYITKKIIKKETPKSILIDHEYNFYGKGFMINSKIDKYPKIIALQHELVYPGCVHSHIKEKIHEKKDILWRPLPDKKCVWGDYSKKVLINTCNYPKEIIEITGNPKFDSLINKKYDKNKIIKKYNLNEKNKKILFASQNLPFLYKYILKIATEFKNIKFIIKPHPREDLSRLNKYFENKVKNIKITPIRSNIYEFLEVSDILITFTSTVAIEAMIKKVPVIILNPNNVTPKGLPYIKEKAALEAISISDLKRKISLLLKKEEREKLLKRSNAFVSKQNYKNDGKATERVFKVIMNTLK